MNRRDLLKLAGGGALNAALAAGAGAAMLGAANATTPVMGPGVRRLAFINTHTGDHFSDAYWEAGNYVPDALAAIRHVMRDHRSGEEHEIDPRLLDRLVDLNGLVEGRQPFQIISGYRSPATNAMLHEASTGVATHSLHMDGRAIDIRMSGVDLTRLRDAALAQNAGGTGYYAASDFIHVDTGGVRRW